MVSAYLAYVTLYNLQKLAHKYRQSKKNKRPSGLNGHLSIRDFTLTSCQRCSYLYINSPVID